MRRTSASLCLLAAALGFGCGDSASSGGGGSGAGSSGGDAPQGGSTATQGGEAEGGGGAGTGAGTIDGGSDAGGASAGGGDEGGAGGASNGFAGLSSLGSLVVLGDSIGDGGGQSPFYYNLLRDQLEAKYGTIMYQRKAESGSETDSLVGQINSLPNTLAGPVAVTITSGGNDMKSALAQIIGGNDAGARAQMGQNIDAALDALLEPNRFGAGVQVYVFEATIYDASDGQGDFGQNGCAFGNGLPAIPTDGFFANWNAVIEQQLADHQQILMDVHGYFYGHGYHASPDWYASDCTHPNSMGHAELAGYFFDAISDDP